MGKGGMNEGGTEKGAGKEEMGLGRHTHTHTRARALEGRFGVGGDE